MSARQEGETAQAWYRRLVQERQQLELDLRSAKQEASQEINERAAVRKLVLQERGESVGRLQLPERQALKAMSRERLAALRKELDQ